MALSSWGENTRVWNMLSLGPVARCSACMRVSRREARIHPPYTVNLRIESHTIGHARNQTLNNCRPNRNRYRFQLGRFGRPRALNHNQTSRTQQTTSNQRRLVKLIHLKCNDTWSTVHCSVGCTDLECETPPINLMSRFQLRNWASCKKRLSHDASYT